MHFDGCDLAKLNYVDMESEVCTTMRDLECDLSKKIMMFEMLFRKGQEDRGVSDMTSIPFVLPGTPATS